MHRQTIRLALAGIAVFYAFFGGLVVTNYMTLHESDRLAERIVRIKEKHTGVEWLYDPEYKKAEDALTKHVLTHQDDAVYASRASLFGAILLWGTVALGVGGGVLLLTRGKRPG